MGYLAQTPPDLIKTVFPNLLSDRLESQAYLAYLLITQGVSASVTLGSDFSSVKALIFQVLSHMTMIPVVLTRSPVER